MFCLQVQGLSLQFAGQSLFDNLNFHVKQGEWVALLGSSGVGKSTLLRAIAGLEQSAVSAGKIYFASHLKLAWLAQQDCLFPWLSVLDNVQLAQHLKGTKNAESLAKAEALLAAVNMQAHIHKACYQLSGGQRQRVALARTLMQEADLILMDEPFSALDAVTRMQLQDLACGLLHEKTVILVTHDPQEAIRLADSLYILQGQPAQIHLVSQLSGAKPHNMAQATAWQLQEELIAKLMQEAS